ncbi:hypothetical protein MUK42_34003 [Musa troglodytarum]|uniref:Uncharacterized protein n=1 Tax=Musa troglodytarum TaxID=320322 RepID=A0A9E7E833_9LILI|nr:hypothetical protein MUK42_34003 [Musa troglodytarum]
MVDFCLGPLLAVLPWKTPGRSKWQKQTAEVLWLWFPSHGECSLPHAFSNDGDPDSGAAHSTSDRQQHPLNIAISSHPFDGIYQAPDHHFQCIFDDMIPIPLHKLGGMATYATMCL